MKKIIKVFAVAFAAVALFSCAKEIQAPEDNNTPIELDGSEQIVNFAAGPVTRTVFGTQEGSTIPTLWTDSYSVAVSLNLISRNKSTTPVVQNAGASATFSVGLVAGENTSFKFYAVSPYDQCPGVSAHRVQIEVPTAQTPTASSPDETAQILYGSYDAGDTFPTTTIAMDFSHLTAYGKISFSNLSLADGETVASVSLTTHSTPWAGRYYYYVEADTPHVAGDFVANSASNTITVTTNRTTDIWFGCAPVDLRNEEIDVVINTNKGTTYAKTITIPNKEKYKFESGKVNQFTINMNGITAGGAVVYTLVDDVADLTLDSEVIIVANSYNYAISTTQNGNNRARAAITKSTNTISSPGADVQVLTIANGNKAGTYALKAGSDFLYAISSQNYLRTKNTLANDGSWSISVTNEGVATIKSIGTSDTRVIKYNNGSSIFSCYTSGQSDVCIYKKNGTGSGAITPKEAESLSITGAKTSFSVGDVFSFGGTVKVVFSDTSEETLTASDYTVDDSDVNMASAGTYTVTVSYNDDPTINASYEITVSAGGPTLKYTLDGTTTGGTSGYDTESSIMQSAISWIVTGNTTMNPWRIGGKSISKVDRVIYSTTAISSNISSIQVKSGSTASSLTVNSLTISVHNTAADAESGDNAIATKSVTSGIASSTVTFDKADETSWAGKFYRIVYNVTRTGSSGNGYITLENVKFYGI